MQITKTFGGKTMINSILAFGAAHPMMAFTFTGCLAGTLFTYIAPDFTRNTLVADEYFCLGNLGITTFIHANWGHFIGNMIFALPAIYFDEKFYGNTFLILFTIFYSVLSGLGCYVFKKCGCGFSGIAYSLLAMACVWGLHWYGLALLALIFIIELCQSIGDTSRIDHFSHFIGLISGAVIGYFLQPARF